MDILTQHQNKQKILQEVVKQANEKSFNFINELIDEEDQQLLENSEEQIQINC